MVGMIEQINGTGLSGILGKSGKSAKGGLFAKLMAMLDKQGQGKGKGLFTATEPDALAAKKGKMILNLSEKSSLTRKQLDESGNAVATVLFVNGKPEASLKLAKGEQSGLIIGKPETSAQPGKGEKGEFIVGKPETSAQSGKGEKGEFIIGKPETSAQPGKGEKGEFIVGKAEASAQSAKGEHPLLTTGKPETSAQPGKGEKGEFIVGKAEASAQSAKGEQPLLTTGKPETSAQPGTLLTTGKPETSAQLSKGEEALNSASKAEFTSQLQKSLHPATSAALKEGEISGQKGNASPVNESDTKTASAKVSTTIEADVKEISAAKSNSAAFAAAQARTHNKGTQGQSQQVPVQSSAAASVVSSGLSDASSADSGGQTSERGSQDGRMMSAMSGDTKSGSTSSTNNTQFQSYMTSKTAPVMTVFDSMSHIAQSAKNGQTKLEIQLDPAHLGKIQITLQTDASKQLQVHMVVDQGTTRAAIDQQLPVLRAALAQQGFDLSGFSMGSQSQESGFGSDGSGSGSSLAKNGESNSSETQAAPLTQHSASSSESGLSIRV